MGKVFKRDFVRISKPGKKPSEINMNELETENGEAPTLMDIVVSGYSHAGKKKDIGLFCVLRVRDARSAELAVKKRGVEAPRYFWYPRDENTIPDGYTEVRGYKDELQGLREVIMAALRESGVPFVSNVVNREPRVYRMSR